MARRRRPMSAATKAKIAAAQKGNKNAYKGGKVKPGALGGKRDKKSGIKEIRNKGYGKRRAAANLAGTAAVGLLTLGPSLQRGGYAPGFGRNKRGKTMLYDHSNPKSKGYRRKGGATRGGRNARLVLAAGIAGSVARSHKLGMAKRNARKNGTVLVVRKRKGRTNVYKPVAKKKSNKKK